MLDFIKAHPTLSFSIIYFLAISILSSAMCVYDKKVSKKGRVELRIPEKSLLALSAFGGSVSMLITMILIRHKTKHLNFMIGIPLMIILQAIIVYFLASNGLIFD